MKNRWWLVVGLLLISSAPSVVHAGEVWVNAIRTSSVWAVFPCKDYLVTVACSTAKDYSDPGNLPPIIKISDKVRFTDKDGKNHDFEVEAINFFVYEKDVDTTWGGQKLTAKKGETSCSLYDSKKAFKSPDYLSMIVIKGCSPLQ